MKNIILRRKKITRRKLYKFQAFLLFSKAKLLYETRLNLTYRMLGLKFLRF